MTKTLRDLTPRRPADGVLALDFREAAWLLGVHPNTVRNLVDRGELPVIALGRRRLVPRSAVEQLVGVPA